MGIVQPNLDPPMSARPFLVGAKLAVGYIEWSKLGVPMLAISTGLAFAKMLLP